jgi:citrate synthase
LGAHRSAGDDGLLRDGINLIAQVPILIGAHHAARTGRRLVIPSNWLSFSEYFLTLLSGSSPSASLIDTMNQDLILHADLSANPASFAARVAMSCEAGMHAALTAAISVFNGPLHGGAAEAVLAMVDAIGSPERANDYVTDCWARKAPIMGFGHRIFRVEDPRVRHFRKAAHDLGVERGNLRDFAILQAVEQAMLPYGRYGVRPNVDLYAGIIYRLIGLPDDLTVPIFVAGRTLGWVAQALEQRARNILIYPTMKYVGAKDLAFPGNCSPGAR